jgi:cyclopropane fatty-acyl-phospholipid synthase-like methyltransferase
MIISDRGYWTINNEELKIYNPGIFFDKSLSQELIKLFVGHTVADFGCGDGKYVEFFIEQGINCVGFDGNPNTKEISNGFGTVLDLSEEIDLGVCFDWVISLEVGEHIPEIFEQNFINNLHKHNKNGIILSWAVPGQGGTGHCNEKSNDYIKSKFDKLGHNNDLDLENHLRKHCRNIWFKDTLMVFRNASLV